MKLDAEVIGIPALSKPVSLADIAYALEFLDAEVLAHVDSRAAQALEEIETVLRVELSMKKPASGFSAKLRQLLGIKPDAVAS